jgi:peptidoglycan hydrolase-like protein with peptidoglycan-binding domain
MRCVKNATFVILVFFTVVSLPVVVLAGGDRIYVGSVTLNGMAPGQKVNPREVMQLCYRAESYLYSGHRDEYAYTVMAVRSKLTIEKSVGRRGANNPEDVRKIQGALKNLNYYRGQINGSADENLFSAIDQFQQDHTQGKPDGRVDVSGRSIRVLRNKAVETFVLSSKRKVGDTRHYTLSDCVAFVSPANPGIYEVGYCQLPLIVAHPVGRELHENNRTVVVLGQTDRKLVEQHANRYGTKRLFELRVKPAAPATSFAFATYLRVNDEFPTLNFSVPEGNSDQPVRFSWHVRPAHEAAEHRFRLYPDQVKWSPWGKINNAEYYFIGPGSHGFEVESRYKDSSGGYRKTPRTYYEFVLEKAFVSKPVILKATTGRGPEGDLPMPDLRNLYGRSNALLIGISSFQDQKLSPLPFVDSDIAAMKAELHKLGFEVETLKGKVTRNEVIGKLHDMVSKLDKNDRMIVYFSTHGFQDETVKSKGYIACHDCDTKRPNINCISLDTLEDLVGNAVERDVRHLLVMLDTCSSGLGVISKSPEYRELHIAVQNGTHMITAGMADQEAQMDTSLRMSTFTYYLTQGLAGKADYTGDDVISLTELLLFVRYNVATKTSGMQTPMMGRISGAGEMIFDLRTRNP